MPPKKKKKGRKSRSSTPGGQDTVGATLKARLEEVTAEYEAGVARREALGKARLERMEVLAALEAEAELRRRGQDDAGERALERHEEAVSDLEGRIDELSAERASLEVELGALDLAVGTNERLRHEVFDARRAFEKEDGLMGGEEARVKEASFEMRMQIEGLSRRTLRDLDSDYKASAEQNIELEARTAAEHNRELSKRLEARSLEAVELLAAQSGRAKRLRDTRVVREMLADAKREHDARIDKITRQKARAESTAIEKNADIADAHAALRAAQRQRDVAVEAAKRLAYLHAKLDQTRASTVRRRSRALALARALDKCAVDFEARAALGAPPPTIAVDADYPRLVDTPTRAPRALGDDEGDASATTADDDDDDGGGLGGDHFSNLACIRMWNSRLA